MNVGGSKLPFSEAPSFVTSSILPFSTSHVDERFTQYTCTVVSAEGLHFSAFQCAKFIFDVAVLLSDQSAPV